MTNTEQGLYLFYIAGGILVLIIVLAILPTLIAREKGNGKNRKH